MKMLTPDIVYGNVYDIRPEDVRSWGVDAIVVDIDGTLARKNQPDPPEKTTAWLHAIKESGISVMALSNNRSFKRVSRFCRDLGIEYIHFAGKPFKKAFLTAQKILGMSCDKIAVIGDQIFTDVLGGNRMGMKTVFVGTMDKGLIVNIRLFFERPFIKPKN